MRSLPSTKIEYIEIPMPIQNFDMACEYANSAALMRFNIGEDGYIGDPDFDQMVDRSQSSLRVRFDGYERGGSMAGQTHIYSFHAWIEPEEED